MRSLNENSKLNLRNKGSLQKQNIATQIWSLGNIQRNLISKWIQILNCRTLIANMRKQYLLQINSKYSKIFISKILDSVDKPLYSYIIEQKPSTVESLVNFYVNFCEVRPVTSLPNHNRLHLKLLLHNFHLRQISNSLINN